LENGLDEVGITVNKNVIADDPRKPLDPSGIRFGTPALTTRGFLEKECTEVAQLMLRALKGEKVRQKVSELAQTHPVPTTFV